MSALFLVDLPGLRIDSGEVFRDSRLATQEKGEAIPAHQVSVFIDLLARVRYADVPLN